MLLTNSNGETVIEVVDEGDGNAKILFYKPKDMTIIEWRQHIEPFQQFMNKLNIRTRRENG